MSANQGNVTPDNQNLGKPEGNGYEKPPVWLIITVIVLGLAIIGMLVVIVMKVLIGDKDQRSSVPGQVPGNSGRIENIEAQAEKAKGLININYKEALEVNRPAGSTLVSSQVSGRYISLTFRLENGGDTVLVLDRVDGSIDTVSIPAND